MRGVLTDQVPIGFEVDGNVVDVRVRSSNRARAMRITIGPRRALDVVVPTGTPEERIRGFLRQKRSWIEEKRAWSQTIANRPSVLGLDRPDVVWLDGDPIRVEPINGSRAVARTYRDNRLIVCGPAEQHPAALERWYRREARRRLTAIAEREADRLGVEYKSIGIRDPKTRWGSCSRAGHISFSWRLVLAPTEIQRYVVVHELCHLIEPNHSKSFWRTLEAAHPGWQEASRWLREYGHELHFYRLERAFERAG